MAKQILTVGVDLATDAVSEEDFDSRTSLLDWDIILFRPSIESWISYRDQYKGKPSLDDQASFKIKEASEHWRREIKQAFESGKTIVVFLPAIQEVYIDTGERRYSGTGRNRSTTRIVDLFNNYQCIPLDLNPVNANGTLVKLAFKGAEVLAPYWSEFAEYSEYCVLIQNNECPPTMQTRNGDKTVGTLLRHQKSGGSIVCLPDIDFYQEGFLESEDGDKGTEWTGDARKFAARLVSSIVGLDAALQAEGESTPEPGWAVDPRFALGLELTLRSKLLEVESELERVQRNKEDVLRQLADAGSLRGLLYEKGKALEKVVIAALKLLGFDAKPFREGASEFDVVFESTEGRLIGEAEGKDSKAINVDKLRQLAMNLHEDLQREEVTAPAKGVLFGNAYRLTAPDSRTEQAFTDKCIVAAKSNGTALLATSELFHASQYLSSRSDGTFASACRQAILNGTGVISLPKAPVELLTPTEAIER